MVSRIPKLKFSKDYFERLKKAQASEKRRREVPASTSVSEHVGETLPKKFSRICSRCGHTTVHTVTELGYCICTVCHSQTTERIGL